ncbi:recombinase family protein [Alkalibacillus haloalkaliphilus]|uniref:recombinase family protein n=1 Tax=Alkalibacillus haloalkaliphilus TaxID=94136 RepID=UPI002935434C|nr:recombinase family protein [Alkalibacillus haloalkaliphilus]MDV2581680.1 recombinase family protein [Alkalibacillus haloalkaliphilus]
MEIRIGYCRVSSVGQNLDRQIVALEREGVEKFFVEKVSGKSRERPELEEMLGFVREGDVVVIESISRLARNTKDFLEIINELTEKEVEVVSLKENINTSTVQGRFICTIFGALYELERDSIKERQLEGIIVAKEKGVKFGRPPISIDEQFISEYDNWKSGSQTAVTTYKKLDISRSSFYRKVKEYERMAKFETKTN